MVDCPQCGFANIAHARFCNDCGARLEPPCPPEHSPQPASFAIGRAQARSMPGEAGNPAGALTDIRSEDRSASPETMYATRQSARVSWDVSAVGAPGHIFVGRERELALLRQAYDAAHADRSNVVLLAGEPGIGKTSLAEETAAYARLRGGQALWGRCTEWSGAPPYWPWVQILRGYVQAQTDTQLARDLSYYGPFIAPVVSTVRERLPDIPEPPPAEADQARFCLFDSIAGVLRNASQREPLVLVLDDLHWADPDSLLLLEFIANAPGIERARLLIVGTYRDMEVGRRHPLTKTVDSLQRVLRLQRTALQGLTAADVARLVTLTAGFEPARALIEAIERETDGNPFFVNEVVRLLAEAGELHRDDAARGRSLAIPQSCKDAIGRRLDRLSVESNTVLSIASVIGRTFSHPILDRVCDLPAERVLDALAEARDARLITSADEPNHYRFVHALVQESLYDEIAPGERMRLHARVGEALAQIHAANLAPMDGEIAYHFANAAPIGLAEPAVTHATRAGKRAMDQFAWEAAAQQFERALHAMEFLSEPDVTQRCDLLLDLGDAQFRTVLDVSDSPVGSDAFLRAAEIARSIGSSERLAHAAIGFAGINLVRTPGGFTQTALLEAALAVYPDRHSALYARLLARLGADLRIVPGAEARIEEISRSAVELARKLGDPGVLAYALSARHVAIWGPDNLEERMSLAQETLQMGKQAGDLVLQAWAILPLAADAYEAGDRALFDATLDAQLETAQRAGIPYFVWAARLQSLSRQVLDGRFAEADIGLQQVGGNSKSLVATYFRTLLQFLRGYAIGDLEEFEEPLQELVDMTVGQVSPFDRHRGNVVALARLIVLFHQGRIAETRAGFERFATTRMPGLMKDSYWLATAVLLAELCALLDERETGREQYARLLPYAGRNAAAGSGLINLGPVSRYLGLLAALDGNRTLAIEHLGQALRESEQIGALPMVALTQLELARVSIESGTPTHLARASVLVENARITATRLGMRGPLQRCDALVLEIERKRGERAGGNRFGLTRRELDVLGKLAERCSNAQIAEALFITEATARTHVDNILGKLGVHSRTDAVDLARREGLLTYSADQKSRDTSPPARS